MDIEGRSYYPPAKAIEHKAVKRSLRELIGAVGFEAETRTLITRDDSASPLITLDHLKLKKHVNEASKTLYCITLSNVLIDSSVLDAVGAKLELLHQTPFYLIANGETALYATGGYEQRLDNVVQSATPTIFG